VISKLGQPDIQLEGLELWIHSRQFPKSEDYWDGNWVNVTARCQSDGSSVHVSGPFLHLPELLAWRSACDRLYQSLRGEANLETKEPELAVKLTGDGLGHVSIEVCITPNVMNQRHTFRFHIDQTLLPDLVSQIDGVLEKYPVREGDREPAT